MEVARVKALHVIVPSKRGENPVVAEVLGRRADGVGSISTVASNDLIHDL